MFRQMNHITDIQILHILAPYHQHGPVESHVHMHRYIWKITGVNTVIIKAEPLLIEVFEAYVMSSLATFPALTLSRYIYYERVEVVHFL